MPLANRKTSEVGKTMENPFFQDLTDAESELGKDG